MLAAAPFDPLKAPRDDRRVAQTGRPTVTDETLAEAKAGSQPAFAAIVREHQAMVYGLAYNFVHSRHQAEEMAQEVFLSLHQHLDRMESPVHLVHWLRRVTSNRCIDSVRRLSYRFERTVGEIPEQAVDPRPADPWLAPLLQRAVAELPPHPRMIVTLRFQEDLQPIEIADVLGMPVNTVKSHLRRSMETLREKLEALGYSNES
jgi:RNA polymerase sigma-70 factor (ECF subfamily)